MQTKLSPSELEKLEKIAHEMRISILKMVFNAQSGHLGGNFSAVELILALYKKILNHDKNWDKSKDFKNRKMRVYNIQLQILNHLYWFSNLQLKIDHL